MCSVSSSLMFVIRFRLRFSFAKFWYWVIKSFLFLKFLFIYFFIFRDWTRKGEREKETSVHGCLLCAPYWWPGPHSHVPWLGIQPVTLWFTGWHSIYWAIAARSELLKVLRNTFSVSFEMILYCSSPINVVTYMK